MKNLKNFAMPLVLVALCIFFGLKEPAFLGPRNLTQLFIEFSTVATLALGMFTVILTGNIDLSVGSGVGLIGGISAVLIFQRGWSAPAAMGAGLGAAMVLWFLTGALIVKQRIPSFIITLGGLLIFKGLFWLTIQNSTVPVSRGDVDNLYSLLTTYYLPVSLGWALGILAVVILGYVQWSTFSAVRNRETTQGKKRIGILRWVLASIIILGLVAICNRFRGVPLTVVILSTTALLISFITTQTPFGRYLYAIGGNEEASVLSGINVDRVVIGSFLIMGITVAITGFMTTAYSGASTTTVGDLMELDAIAACVIGGTALKGGKGTVSGVLFGALVMTTLLNGMTLLAVPPELKFIARGTVLALAVWLDVRFSDKR